MTSEEKNGKVSAMARNEETCLPGTFQTDARVGATTTTATAADVRMLWEAIDSLRARVMYLENGHPEKHCNTPPGFSLFATQNGRGETDA